MCFAFAQYSNKGSVHVESVLLNRPSFKSQQPEEHLIGKWESQRTGGQRQEAAAACARWTGVRFRNWVRKRRIVGRLSWTLKGALLGDYSYCSINATFCHIVRFIFVEHFLLNGCLHFNSMQVSAKHFQVRSNRPIIFLEFITLLSFTYHLSHFNNISWIMHFF